MISLFFVFTLISLRKVEKYLVTCPTFGVVDNIFISNTVYKIEINYASHDGEWNEFKDKLRKNRIILGYRHFVSSRDCDDCNV